MVRSLFLTVALVVAAFNAHGEADDNDSALILDLARQTIETVRYASLVTVDDMGQPRTRIVDAFAPDEDFVVYVATKPVTRKVEQIRQHNKVTLFYFDPEGRNYVSLMGVAELIDDVAVKRAKRRDSDTDRIYPAFPDDYLLIRIEPLWLEGLLPGYRGDKETWMPARVNFNEDALTAR